MKIPKTYKGYKFKVSNSHKYFGTTDTDKKTVIINKEKSLKAGGEKELADTIKHEKMHIDHPNMHEKTVEEKLKHKETSQVDKTELSIKGLI